MLIKVIYLHRSQDGCRGERGRWPNCSVALITNRWENSLKREKREREKEKERQRKLLHPGPRSFKPCIVKQIHISTLKETC